MNYLGKVLAGAATLGALALGLEAAHAVPVCSGCEYQGDGTYLGEHDPATNDTSTFTHTDVTVDEGGAGVDFEDFWVFDVTMDGIGAVSANIVVLADIDNFAGSLHMDAGGTSCGPGAPSLCAAVDPVLTPIASDSGDTWQFVVSDLTAGTYILRITGTTTENSAYSGQLSFDVPEPGTLALLGLGLIGLGAASRRRVAA